MRNPRTDEATYVYERTSTELAIAGCGVVTVQGICCRDAQGNQLDEIPDVSVDVAAVDRLVGLMNAHAVSGCHMKDVVEDFVAVL